MRGADVQRVFETILPDKVLMKLVEANVLWEYGFMELRIELTDANGKARRSLPIGESSQARALLQPSKPELLSQVTWSIAERTKGVIVDLGATTGAIQVPQESEEGEVTIDARIGSQLFTQVRVHVGCECEACNGAGACTPKLGSVDLTFHLGSGQDGLSAGSLYVNQQTLGADAYKRAAVQLSSLGGVAEGVTDKQGLRQVVSPATFVQVEDLSSGGYELRFYPPSVQTSDQKDPVTGLYPVSLPNADNPLEGALATWRMFDPGPGPSGAKRLRVQELREGGAVDRWFKDNMSGLDDVIEVRVPGDVYERSYKHPNIDGTGPGFCVECSDLPLIKSVPK